MVFILCMMWHKDLITYLPKSWPIALESFTEQFFSYNDFYGFVAYMKSLYLLASVFRLFFISLRVSFRKKKIAQTENVESAWPFCRLVQGAARWTENHFPSQGTCCITTAIFFEWLLFSCSLEKSCSLKSKTIRKLIFEVLSVRTKQPTRVWRF